MTDFVDDFVPDEGEEEEFKIPYFEDASGELGIVGYSTTLTENQLQAKIREAAALLKMTIVGFAKGKKKDRHAYRIYFTQYGAKGQIDIAALPIRKSTERREQQAKRQALFTAWKRLEAAFNSRMNMPNDFPFIGNILGPKGVTLGQMLISQELAPALPPPHVEGEDNEGEGGDAMEGEFHEVEDE